MTAMLCCEGRACGNGQTADEREADIIEHLPRQSVPLREEAERYARQMTSRELKVTPHTLAGTDGRGNHRYACQACGHERLFGNVEHVGAYDVATSDRRYYFGRGTFRASEPLA